MSTAESFAAYLEAKQTVDDRALDAGVRARLLDELGRRRGHLEVIEIGAGIGTMIERLASWGLLRDAHYTALDAEAVNVSQLIGRLRARGFSEPARGSATISRGSEVEVLGTRAPLAPPADAHFEVERDGLRVRAVHGDFFRFAATAAACDLVVAHAVLDLFDLDTALPPLLELARPGGLLYLTVTYDGETRFEPPLALDGQVEMLYNRSMDSRITDGRPSGDSLSGRHLIAKLVAAGVEILASGRSDWVVGPGCSAAEASFVAFILDTLAGALAGHPELNDTDFVGWMRARRSQLETGTLGFRARHVDVLARKPAG